MPRRHQGCKLTAVATGSFLQSLVRESVLPSVNMFWHLKHSDFPGFQLWTLPVQKFCHTDPWRLSVEPSKLWNTVVNFLQESPEQRSALQVLHGYICSCFGYRKPLLPEGVLSWALCKAARSGMHQGQCWEHQGQSRRGRRSSRLWSWNFPAACGGDSTGADICTSAHGEPQARAGVPERYCTPAPD